MVGVIDDSGRLRGAHRVCSLPIRPNALGTPGCSEKSSISSLSTMPVLPADQVRAEGEVHGRGQRHRVALGVGDGEVRGAVIVRGAGGGQPASP